MTTRQLISELIASDTFTEKVVVSTRDGKISRLYDVIEVVEIDGNVTILTRDDYAENDDISS